jgi:hypothetical protein
MLSESKRLQCECAESATSGPPPLCPGATWTVKSGIGRCYSLTVPKRLRGAGGVRLRPLSSLVEHFLGKEEVVGPIPTGGSALRSAVALGVRMARGGVAQVVRAHGS